jgi:hypothetical protein
MFLADEGENNRRGVRTIRQDCGGSPLFYLHLLFDESPRLVRLRFADGEPPDDPDAGWVEVKEGCWVKGLKAICLLCIKAKRQALGPAGPAGVLTGAAGSAAKTLYDLKRGQEWTKAVFGDEQGKIFQATSCGQGGKRRQDFTVSLKGTLPADRIRLGRWADGKPVWFETDEPLAALERGLEACFAQRPRNGPGARAAPAAAAPARYALPRPMRVAVLLGSTNLPYTDAIFRSLKHWMTAGPFAGPGPVVDRVKSLPDDASDVEAAGRLADEFRKCEAARKADYWVAIGSPAVVALRRSYGGPEKLVPEKPLLSLGVTNPGSLALPTQAPHSSPVAVVRYGRGLDNYAHLLDEVVFRDLPQDRRRFAFVYTRGISHDDGAASELRRLPMVCDSGRLKLCPFRAYPTAAQLKRACGGRIIWGWYTLEYLLKEGLLADKDLAEMVVVSTIQEHAQKGLSGVAVQPSDEEIGRLGAELLLKDFTGGGPPGHSFGALPVQDAPDYFWLNLEALGRWEGRLGFRVSEEVEGHRLCKGVYGERRAGGGAAGAARGGAELVGPLAGAAPQ